tara:strand:- start:3540 stop:4208 length:669 start_codon:yes stop_codon:yes gene_type:complete
MEIKLNNDWDNILNELLNKTETKQLFNFIKKERKEKNIFPKESEVFKAFELCSFKNTKIIIIGQDPYHKINQANGLAFSVPKKQKLPPSLKNIFKELNNDMPIKITNNGNLSNWAKQGVLLLNCIMTVRENEPGSHSKSGWEDFTDIVIKILSNKKKHIIFLLWGEYAKKKQKLINKQKHNVLVSAHPSPLSAYRGFFGCKHFSKANEILRKKNRKTINWKI